MQRRQASQPVAEAEAAGEAEALEVVAVVVAGRDALAAASQPQAAAVAQLLTQARGLTNPADGVEVEAVAAAAAVTAAAPEARAGSSSGRATSEAAKGVMLMAAVSVKRWPAVANRRILAQTSRSRSQ